MLKPEMGLSKTLQMTVSCTMGPFYYTLAAMRDYVTSHGVAQQTASSFIAATYLGLAQDAHAAVEPGSVQHCRLHLNLLFSK